jgi:hypothetical protein
MAVLTISSVISRLFTTWRRSKLLNTPAFEVVSLE